MIDNEKGKILFAKPLNAILAAGDKLKSDNENEIKLLSNEITLLSASDSDLDEREEQLAKADRKISRKINSLGEDLDAEIRNLVRKGGNELEDLVDASCNRMLNIVQNEWGCLKSVKSILPRLDRELQSLTTRKLKRATEQLSDEGERKLKRSVADFFSDAEEILLRYLPDFDSRYFIKSTQNRMNMEMEKSDLFSSESDTEEEVTWGDVIVEICGGILNGATFGILEKTNNVFSHGDNVAQISDYISSLSRDFDPEPYLKHAFKSKDKIIEFVRSRFVKELIEPLREQLTRVRSQKENKEKQQHNVEEKRKKLEEKKALITAQVQELAGLKLTVL